MSLEVIVHRGSRQIGGTCVELRTHRHRLLIDVGAPLDDLAPHALPPIPGVSVAGSLPDAILLSHAHPDHCGLLHLVPQQVPVWLTSGTSKMLLAANRYCGQPRLPKERERKLRWGAPVKIGDFTVTALAVDHSIYGASAFLVEAHGRRVLYTGDLRMHGPKPGMTRKLIASVNKAPLDLLLIEGTHLSRPTAEVTVTERELQKEISRLIDDAPSLVLAFFSPQHLDRLVAFYKAAKRRRTFVVDPYTAFVMYLLHREVNIPHPARAPRLRALFPKRRRIYPTFERQLVGARITAEEISAAPEEYVLLARTAILEDDFGNEPPRGSVGIYSMWHGYLQRDAMRRAEETLRRVGGSLVPCHTSGHAMVKDLVWLIEKLQPKRIIPIHTERPEALNALARNVDLAQDGVPLTL